MSPCLYHESLSNPILYHKKYSFQVYRNADNKNTEIQISEVQKYKLEFYINKNYSNTEKQNTRLKKHNL